MEPWMSKSEISAIKSHLDKDDLMFEWGCGGSTLTFSLQVNKYHSVEHTKQWYDKIKTQTPKNVVLYHVNPNEPNWTPSKVKWTTDNGRGEGKEKEVMDSFKKEFPFSPWWSARRYYQFCDYVNKIKLTNLTFNKILIDGRARTACCYRCYEYLNDDGLLFVHDYVPRAETVIKKYSFIPKMYEEVDRCETLCIFKKRNCNEIYTS